jgi:hypothetical protein
LKIPLAVEIEWWNNDKRPLKLKNAQFIHPTCDGRSVVVKGWSQDGLPLGASQFWDSGKRRVPKENSKTARHLNAGV